MRHAKRQPLPIISLLLVTGFLVTSLASFFVARSSLRDQIASNALPLTSDNVYSEIQNDLFRPILISSLMANDTFVRDWVLAGETDVPGLTRYLSQIKQEYGAFTSFFVSEKTRIYYQADGVLKAVSEDQPRDVWYFRVRQMAEPYEINIDPDLANNDAMTVFVNYRVYDYEGHYIGATGIGVAVETLRTLIEDYQSRFSRTIYFLDADGTVRLAGADFPANVTNVLRADGYAGFAEQFRAKHENAFTYRRFGETIHTNVRYIPEFDWYLVVEQPEGSAVRQVYSTLLANLAICAVITAVVLVLVKLTISAYQSRIDTLRGIVPICSWCKKVRDDKGYWNQVEAYVAQYTDAEFSHAICPDCLKKHFPEFAEDEPAPSPEATARENKH